MEKINPVTTDITQENVERLIEANFGELFKTFGPDTVRRVI